MNIYKSTQFLFFIILMAIITSCKNDKTLQNESFTTNSNSDKLKDNSYPENVFKIFETHGGYENWESMQSLSFGISNENGVETTTTHLKTRQELIDNPNFQIGFDGHDVWLINKGDFEYKRNPRFYKGLMFYFYAMPFVLGDQGIFYSEVKPLEFEGKTYPGILISYDNGIGDSPEDQYILYFNKDTYNMEWLSYTVTFGKNQKSKDFHFIRYDRWQDVNGLKLPKASVGIAMKIIHHWS